MKKELFEEIEFGKSGGNDGIPMSFTKFSKAIGGLQPSRYDLIGGNTGTGKTAFADDQYVLSPIEYIMENVTTDFSVHVTYYSQEISRRRKIAKIAARRLYKKYGILVSFKDIISYGEDKLIDPKHEKLLHQEGEYFERLKDYLDIREGGINPTGIYMDTKYYMEKHGNYICYDPIAERTVKDYPIGAKKEDVWKDIHKQRKDYDRKDFLIRFVPKDRRHIKLIVVDHVGLLRGEKSKDGEYLSTKKRIIDKHSEYAVDEYRDLWGCSVLDISQFNRDIGDIQRKKFGEITPQLEDFKETGATQENADTVIALFNPARYNLEEYRKINTSRTGMGGRYRGVFRLKDRNGADMAGYHSHFIGECGVFNDFPEFSSNLDNAHYEQLRKGVKL